MLARRSQGTGSHPVRRLSLGVFLALLLSQGLLPEDVVAQRPFQIIDPFYRSETARRDFFDRYAVRAEVSYQSVGALRGEDVPTSGSDLAFSFRFDYQLASRLDLGAIFDAIGNSGGRRVSLSWLVLKYYRHLERSDYSFRLAVDPSSDGRVGFPQVDLAFLYTSLLSPKMSSDFAMGMRRVNIGYAQFLPAVPPGENDPLVVRPHPSLLFTRALGTELHMMMNYSVHFDPAGSNLFMSLVGEGGQYDLIESPLDNQGNSLPTGNTIALGKGGEEEPAEGQQTDYRGGVIWFRAGIEFNRPSYQVLPYLSFPLQQWTPDAEGGDWPVARLNFGLRLMLR